MKKLSAVLILLLLSSLSLAQENLGQKVRPTESFGRGPEFGVQYMHEKLAHDFDALILMRSEDLSADRNLKNLSYRVYDAKSHQYLTPWTLAEDHGTGQTMRQEQSVLMRLEGETLVNTILDDINYIDIVLSVNAADIHNPAPTHYVALGSYCFEFPQRFYDGTKLRIGCDPFDKQLRTDYRTWF